MSQREKNLCTVSIAIKLLFFVLPLLESNLELELNKYKSIHLAHCNCIKEDL